MPAQVLDRVLRCFRIGDPDGAYPIFDATGSVLAPGRWNTAASPIIYTSEHFSTALLEKLVRGQGRLPRNQHYIEVTIPNGASYEVVNITGLQGWDDRPAARSKLFGQQWHSEQRSLILIVPSVVARLDNNILINPGHPEFGQVTHTLHRPVWWDRRLFGNP